jgi:mannitol/fructose-specific phosphotransferase system IIA component (Ntr-type)
MRLHRYLKETNVDLDFRPFAESPLWRPGHVEVEEDPEVEEEELTAGQRFRRKVQILGQLVTLLEPSGKITNPKKCLTDLRNREAKASTAFGCGMAMPHVRTAQAKDFSIGVAIAPEPGLPFDAIDGEPVRIFFPMVAPRYKDRFYLKVERALAGAFADEDDMSFRDSLLQAESPGEVIFLMRERIDAS